MRKQLLQKWNLILILMLLPRVCYCGTSECLSQWGNYSAWVILGYNPDESNVRQATISKTNFINPITIYPNPTSDIITIQNFSGDELIAEILSIDGKLLRQFVINEDNSYQNIEVSELPPGYYLIRASSNSSPPFVTRLVISR